MSDHVCDRCHMPSLGATPCHHLSALGDIYRPNEWHDFFLVVGGGMALTGLVFVAMSINLYIIFRDLLLKPRCRHTDWFRCGVPDLRVGAHGRTEPRRYRQ